MVKVLGISIGSVGIIESAYPFGILADHLDRRLQVGIGAIIMVGANGVLFNANDIWLTALSAVQEERLPKMLRAAVEATVDCRARARGMREFGAWSLNRLCRVAGWIRSQGLVENRRRRTWGRDGVLAA